MLQHLLSFGLIKPTFLTNALCPPAWSLTHSLVKHWEWFIISAILAYKS